MSTYQCSPLFRTVILCSFPVCRRYRSSGILARAHSQSSHNLQSDFVSSVANDPAHSKRELHQDENAADYLCARKGFACHLPKRRSFAVLLSVTLPLLSESGRSVIL